MTDSPGRLRLWLLYWLPLMLYGGLIFFLSSLSHPDPVIVPVSLRFGLHTAEFFVLAILLFRALAQGVFGPAGRVEYLATFSLATAWGFLDEFHQAFVPGRFPDPHDLRDDILGAALALVVIAVVRRVFRKTGEGA